MGWVNPNPLAIGQPPLDASRPYDHEPLSHIPAYLRETRASLFTTDIHQVIFESNVATGDAVYLDVNTNSWKRSVANMEFPERYRFHGIANVDGTRRSVRVFGFISYPFWQFPTDSPIYVSGSLLGKLTASPPEHTKPLMAGYSVQTDALLLDSSLAYWEQLRDEIWNARGSYPYLVDRLNTELDRLVAVEVEISNGRGGFASLIAHFDHHLGRIILLENEVQAARGAFASLGLRLTAADADRQALWAQCGILMGHINRLDDEIDRVDGELDDRYTKREVDQRITTFSDELHNAILALFDGSVTTEDVIWELHTDAISAESTVTCTNGDTFTAGSYFFIHTDWDDYCVWYEISTAGAEPAIGGYTFIKVEILITDAAAAVATATAAAINALGAFTSSATGAVVTIEHAPDGEMTVENGVGLSVFTYADTVSGQLASIQQLDGLGEYFIINQALHLFQGGLSMTVSTRPAHQDLSAVTDDFFQLDGTAIMPRAII